jgi:hypothetical protein
MSFSDIGLPNDVFQYLKWTFPLALFTNYYDSSKFLTLNSSHISDRDVKRGSVGENTLQVGR